MKKFKASDCCNMGTAIGLCTAVGIVLGALFNHLLPGLLIGVGVGVVLGAIIQANKKKR